MQNFIFKFRISKYISLTVVNCYFKKSLPHLKKYFARIYMYDANVINWTQLKFSADNCFKKKFITAFSFVARDHSTSEIFGTISTLINGFYISYNSDREEKRARFKTILENIRLATVRVTVNSKKGLDD